MPFCYVLLSYVMTVFTRRMNLRWSTLTLRCTGIDLETLVIVRKR
jgi:hypothetical protein